MSDMVKWFGFYFKAVLMLVYVVKMNTVLMGIQPQSLHLLMIKFHIIHKLI